VKKHGKITRNKVPCRSGGYLAILLIVTLCTAGCILTEPEDIVVPAPVPHETVTPDHTPVQIMTPTLVPRLSANIPVANLTITHPTTLILFSDNNYPEDEAASLNALSDHKTAETINRYLRWESVRTHTNQTDAFRIERTIKNIDTLIRSSRLEEDLVIYCGITGDVPLKIVNDTRYSEEGYVSCSFDPSVIYHAMDDSGRDREGFVSLMVIPQKRGNYLLYVNETQREILLPRAMIWELNSEEKAEVAVFTSASLPRYHDSPMKNVRLLYMTQIT
jgi:hypothetical protein